jgi:hypothetical protein
MGDTGSMFLGFVLATTAIQTNQKASTAAAIMIPAIALGLPIMDTLLAIARRALRGRPLFQADREHIHHRLMAMGLSHRQTVLVLYGFCIVLGTALARIHAARPRGGDHRGAQAQSRAAGRCAPAGAPAAAAPKRQRDVAHRRRDGGRLHRRRRTAADRSG